MESEVEKQPEIECLAFIFPEGVFNKEAVEIVNHFRRHGLVVIDITTRRLDLDEAKILFHARKTSDDYISFCRNIAISPTWILRLSNVSKLKDALESLDKELAKHLYVPVAEADHKILLQLVNSAGYSRDKLPDIIEQFRDSLDKRIQNDEKGFAEYAIDQGRRFFFYSTAMRIAGFSERQAMTLTENFQQMLLEIELNSSLGNVRNTKEQSDDDED